MGALKEYISTAIKYAYEHREREDSVITLEDILSALESSICIVVSVLIVETLKSHKSKGIVYGAYPIEEMPSFSNCLVEEEEEEEYEVSEEEEEEQTEEPDPLSLKLEEASKVNKIFFSLKLNF